MLWFFLWILWFFLLFRVLLDILRSRDLSGWDKAGWVTFTIILPFLGVLVYLIARGHKMSERDVAEAQASDKAFRTYVHEAAHGDGTADELAKLADLRDRGSSARPISSRASRRSSGQRPDLPTARGLPPAGRPEAAMPLLSPGGLRLWSRQSDAGTGQQEHAGGGDVAWSGQTASVPSGRADGVPPPAADAMHNGHPAP